MSNDSLQAIYGEGLGFDEFLGGMPANAHWFHQVHRRFGFIESDANSCIFQSGTRVLVFCEPYCADCVINLPLIARLVDASPGAELRVTSHDKHKGAAARFPGRGGVSRIPTVVLLDSRWRLLGYWSERGASDREWMLNFTHSDPLPEITLVAGMPVGDFAQWLVRRFEGQLPVFYERNWKDVRDELRALANPRSLSNTR